MKVNKYHIYIALVVFFTPLIISTFIVCLILGISIHSLMGFISGIIIGINGSKEAIVESISNVKKSLKELKEE